MPAHVAFKGVAITAAHGGIVGPFLYDGVATFAASSVGSTGGVIEFDYAYGFKQSDDLAKSIRDGAQRLKRELTDLAHAADQIQFGP